MKGTGSYGDFRRLRQRGEVRCTDVVEAFLERIERHRELNAFLTVTAEQALEAARESDSRFDSAAPRPLEGCVVARCHCRCSAQSGRPI
jgi:aspartyl-tRNA(Asn)/glutamyl-tRNA(Gln) amidotransferase subunit A